MYAGGYMAVISTNGVNTDRQVRTNSQKSQGTSFAEIFKVAENKARELKTVENNTIENKTVRNKETKKDNAVNEESNVINVKERKSKTEADKEKETRTVDEEKINDLLAAIMSFLQIAGSMQAKSDANTVGEDAAENAPVLLVAGNTELANAEKELLALIKTIEDLTGIKLADNIEGRAITGLDVTELIARLKLWLEQYAETENLPDGIREHLAKIDSLMEEQTLNVTVQDELKEEINLDGEELNPVIEKMENSHDVKHGQGSESEKARDIDEAKIFQVSVQGNRDTEAGIEDIFTEDVANISNNQDDNYNLIFNAHIPGNANNINEVFNPTVPLAENKVLDNDIIFSIVDKAKVLVTENQSEIVVDLKPDVLGKVVLKIVAENDYVTAKIITENYRVKDIIETNFQMLKDSLEKQGIVVNDINVSVGNSDSRGRSFENRGKGWSNGKAVTGLSNSINNAPSLKYSPAEQQYEYFDSPYMNAWSYSTINYKV